MRALEEAHEMRIRQEKAFEDYSATFAPSVVSEWEAMVEAWNADPDQPDPYEEPVKCVLDSFIRITCF